MITPPRNEALTLRREDLEAFLARRVLERGEDIENFLLVLAAALDSLDDGDVAGARLIILTCLRHWKREP